MLDLKMLDDETEKVKENLSLRNFDTSIIDDIISLNGQRKTSIQETERIRSEIKKSSMEVGKIKKSGGDAQDLKDQVTGMKKRLKEHDENLSIVQEKIDTLMLTIPNLIEDDTPRGEDESSNKLCSEFGERRVFDFEVKDHIDLGEKLGLLDFEAGARVTGARFVFYKGDLARLERALINFMLDQHAEHGYEEVVPPLIVHERSLIGTGQLPKFKEDLFKLEGDSDWYLIPTAEVPLTNIRRDELFDGSELPINICAYTPCFRSEAGSHGRDTRGLIRLHQFNKVELVNIVAPEKSEEAHIQMIERAKSILEKLELPYRSMRLCTGDIGFGSRKTYDLEVWVPAQNTYREISSLSNCGDFQARRARIRFRGADGKPQFAHTLNGSGLAVGRTVVAIMENYQNQDGSITIPKVLRPYMGGKELIS